MPTFKTGPALELPTVRLREAEQEAAPNGTMSRNRDATAARLHGVASSTFVGGPERPDAARVSRGSPNAREQLRIAFTCSVGADLGRAAEKPLVADR